MRSRIVLRMYWDGKTNPSVETPIGDFFGLGTGVYYRWESLMLSAGGDKALNSYFPMPYGKHARVTITNEGKMALRSLYWPLTPSSSSPPITSPSITVSRPSPDPHQFPPRPMYI